MNDIMRYGTFFAIVLNAALGLMLMENNISGIVGYELLLWFGVAAIGFMGFIVVFGHAIMNQRTKWALAIFFLGPIAQLCYWLFFIFAEGREREGEEIMAEHTESTYSGGWTTPPPSRATRQPKPRPARRNNGLVAPKYLDLGA